MDTELACLWVILAVIVIGFLVWLFSVTLGAWIARVFFGRVPGGRK